jgi:hypothetical protein
MGSRRSEVVNIFHLLFSDDTLIFCGANPKHLRYLCALFLCFDAVSSLKINLAKFVLVLMGCVDNVDVLAGILGCVVSSLPASFKAKSIWDGVVGKIERRLGS